MNHCPFCNPEQEILAQKEHCFAIADKYPVSKGHTLVINRRHAETYFDLSREERTDCWDLVEELKEKLEHVHHPDGWNIGINTGRAAGQTVFHMHIHLIPRYKGDMKNPSGGVRHSVEGMGYY